jgi:hypothetical protein
VLSSEVSTDYAVSKSSLVLLHGDAAPQLPGSLRPPIAKGPDFGVGAPPANHNNRTVPTVDNEAVVIETKARSFCSTNSWITAGGEAVPR